MVQMGTPHIVWWGPKWSGRIHRLLSPLPQIILLQTSSSTARLRYATLGSPPPTRPPSTERPLRVGISPHQTLPSLVLIILGTVWLPLWLGGGSARCRFAWGSFHFRAVVDFTFLVSKLSKKIVQITL